MGLDGEQNVELEEVCLIDRFVLNVWQMGIRGGQYEDLGKVVLLFDSFVVWFRQIGIHGGQNFGWEKDLSLLDRFALSTIQMGVHGGHECCFGGNSSVVHFAFSNNRQLGVDSLHTGFGDTSAT